MRLSSRQLLRFLPAVALLIGCRVAETPRITLPSQFTTTRDPLVVHSDFPFPENHPLLGELAARRADLQELLDLSIPEKPIHVYLFEHGDRFREYLRLYHPELPNRRAFFLPTDARLSVFAQWGDRAAEDLRHEVTHAYLRAAAANLPLWLDEGLAKYCEALSRPARSQPSLSGTACPSDGRDHVATKPDATGELGPNPGHGAGRLRRSLGLGPLAPGRRTGVPTCPAGVRSSSSPRQVGKPCLGSPRARDRSSGAGVGGLSPRVGGIARE